MINNLVALYESQLRTLNEDIAKLSELLEEQKARRVTLLAKLEEAKHAQIRNKNDDEWKDRSDRWLRRAEAAERELAAVRMERDTLLARVHRFGTNRTRWLK